MRSRPDSLPPAPRMEMANRRSPAALQVGHLLPRLCLVRPSRVTARFPPPPERPLPLSLSIRRGIASRKPASQAASPPKGLYSRVAIRTIFHPNPPAEGFD